MSHAENNVLPQITGNGLLVANGGHQPCPVRLRGIEVLVDNEDASHDGSAGCCVGMWNRGV